jgi:Undecaprenyl-phosphate glucose phosphotransferase
LFAFTLARNPNRRPRLPDLRIALLIDLLLAGSHWEPDIRLQQRKCCGFSRLWLEAAAAACDIRVLKLPQNLSTLCAKIFLTRSCGGSNKGIQLRRPIKRTALCLVAFELLRRVMNYNKPHINAPKTLALESFKLPSRRKVRWSISYRVVAPVAMACDAIVIVLMGVLSSIVYHYVYYYDNILVRPDDALQSAGLASVTAFLFIALGKSRGLYNPAELLNLKSEIAKLSVKWVGVLLFLAAAAFTMKAGGNFSRGSTILFAVLGLLALVGERVIWRVILADGLAVRKFSGRKVTLIVEEGSASKSGILEALARHGLEPVHQFVLPADQNDVKARRRVIAKAVSSIRGTFVEEVIIGADLNHWSNLKELLSELRVLPLPVNLVPIGPTADLFNLPSHTIGETLTIELQRAPRTFFERAVKRVIDIVVAGTALLLLFPLFVMTAIAIKLDSPGPVIFRQRRSGFNGRQFQIMKFRTMSVLEDGETVIQAQPNDNRVTRVGSWLRRTSIDELPQLFNVLQGDMSLIGPRPHALAHDTEFGNLVAKYAFRHHVKPGITGWAQVHGFRGRTCNVSDIEKRLELDLWYIDNWSLALDFKIALMTLVEIVNGENAY